MSTSAFKTLKGANQATTILAVLGKAFPQLKGLVLSLASAFTTGASGITIFKTAISGLWTVLATHPIAAVIAAVGALVVGFNAYNQSVQESVNKAKEAGTAWSNSNSSLQSQIDRINELRTALDNGTLSEEEAYEAKAELLEIQQSLSESYGNQVEGIDLVNGSLREQIDLLNEASKAEANKFLNENRAVIAKAEKEMTKTIGGKYGAYLGTFYDNGNEDSEALQKILSKYSDNIEIDTEVDGITKYVSFVGNAEQAETVLNDLMTDFRNASNEVENTYLFDDFSASASEYLSDANSVLEEYQDLYNQAQEARLVTDEKLFFAMDGSGGKTAAKWLSDYASAIEKYNEAIASGDSEQISSAASEFENIDSSMQKLLQNEEFAQYSDQVANVRAQLDETAIAVTNFQNAVNGIDVSGSERAITNMANTIKDANMTDVDFKVALESPTDDATGLAISGIKGFAEQAGISVEELVSILTEAGILTTYVAEGAEDTTSSIASTLEAITTSTDMLLANISAVNEVLNSQATGKSISLEDFNSDELADYQSALEYVNGSMQLNADRVKEITDAKAEEKLATIENTKALEQAKYLENAKEIESLTSRYDELTSAELDTLASLRDEQSQIVSNCTQYDLMAASIREATGAYQAWLDSQNTSESGDMYDDAQSAMEAIQEGLESGKTGTKKYEAAVDFLIPDDIPKSEVDGYMDKLERYLGDSDAGTDNFLNDAVEAGLMSVEDGYYSVIDGIKMSDFVDKLHITPEMAQAIFGELEEYDFEFDWGDEQFGTYGDGITALAMSAGELQTELDKLYADKEAGIEVDDSEIDALEQKLDEVNQKKAELEQASVANIESNIEIDSAISEAEQDVQGWKAAVEADPANLEAQANLESAEAQLAELQQQKSELQEPTVVEITAALSDLDSQIADAQAKLDSLKSGDYSVGMSDEAVTAEIAELSTQIDTLNAKKAEIEAYAETTGAMSDLDALENKEVNDKEFDVTAIDNATRVINSINNLTLNDKSFTITTNKVTNEVSTGNGPVNGTANASGTAHANGKWGNPKRQTVLIGELGREIVVDPNTGRWRTYGDNGAEFADIPKNAIVFNHLQSESLLERGFVTGRGTIKGGAFASGTAFVTGGGKKGANSGDSYTATTTTTTTKTGTKSTTGKTSTAKTKKDGQEFVDWIERAIKKVQQKIQKFQTVADNIYKSFKDRNTALKNQISAVSDEIDIQKKAYDRYIAQANAVDLKSSLKKKVRNGTIDINAYGEKTREKIEEYQKW